MMMIALQCGQSECCVTNRIGENRSPPGRAFTVGAQDAGHESVSDLVLDGGAVDFGRGDEELVLWSGETGTSTSLSRPPLRRAGGLLADL